MIVYDLYSHGSVYNKHDRTWTCVRTCHTKDEALRSAMAHGWFIHKRAHGENPLTSDQAEAFYHHGNLAH